MTSRSAAESVDESTLTLPIANRADGSCREPVADEWLLGAAGAIPFGFLWNFFAVAFRWMNLDPSSAVPSASSSMAPRRRNS